MLFNGSMVNHGWNSYFWNQILLLWWFKTWMNNWWYKYKETIQNERINIQNERININRMNNWLYKYKENIQNERININRMNNGWFKTWIINDNIQNRQIRKYKYKGNYTYYIIKWVIIQ